MQISSGKTLRKRTEALPPSHRRNFASELRKRKRGHAKGGNCHQIVLSLSSVYAVPDWRGEMNLDSGYPVKPPYLSGALHRTWQASTRRQCWGTRLVKAGLSHLKWARMTSTIWAAGEDAVGEWRGPIAVRWTERNTWDQWGRWGPLQRGVISAAREASTVPFDPLRWVEQGEGCIMI